MTKRLILYPELLDSFWTLLYARMWADIEPKLLYFTDPDNAWWNDYYCWLRGEKPFPSEEKKLSFLTRFSTAGLIGLGMAPLFLLLAGGVRMLFGKYSLLSKHFDAEAAKMQIFPVLLIFFILGSLVSYADSKIRRT